MDINERKFLMFSFIIAYPTVVPRDISLSERDAFEEGTHTAGRAQCVTSRFYRGDHHGMPVVVFGALAQRECAIESQYLLSSHHSRAPSQ